MDPNFIFPEKPQFNKNFKPHLKKSKLLTNIFQMRIKESEMKIYIYSIKYSQEFLEDGNQKLKILRAQSLQLKKIFGTYITTNDNLFSTSFHNDIIYIDTNINRSDNYNEEIKLEIKLVKDYELNLQSTDDAFAQKRKHLFEIMIKNILQANGLSRLKTLYFNREIYQEFNNFGLKGNLHPSYQVSLSNLEIGLCCKVNLSNKFISSKSCLEEIKLLEENYNSSRIDFEEKLRETFIGKTVFAKYGKYHFHKVDDISLDKTIVNAKLKRMSKNGNMTELTLQTYYLESYGIEIKDKKQILFIENQKNTGQAILLVPELLYMTGINEEMRMNDRVKREMILKTQLRPNERIKKYEEFRDLFYEEKKCVSFTNKSTGEKVERLKPNQIRKEWGLEIRDQLYQAECKYLDNPIINLNKVSAEAENGNIKVNSKISNPKDLLANRWLLYFNKNMEDKAKSFYENLKQCSERFEIKVEVPRKCAHSCRNSDDHGMKLNEIDKEFKLKSFSIIVILLSAKEKNHYKDLKNRLFTKYGIPSQVTIIENFAKGLSYFTKILFQINFKLQGEIFTIDLFSTFKEKSMFVGFDTSRNSKSKNRKFCMSSTYDKNLALVYTETQEEQDGSNLPPIKSMMSSCLTIFLKKRKFLPEYIFLYRSCVNDKEKKFLIDKEVKPLLELFSGEYAADYKPNLCFIVVNRKSDMKFFETGNSANKNDLRNPGSGMVVDNYVTNQQTYDFYIQPQVVRQGCASPTYFHVICDQTGIPIELLEEISFNLCFYYFNWSGAIRVPNVLKYAEVCNKFTSANLRAPVEDEDLKMSAYFI